VKSFFSCVTGEGDQYPGFVTVVERFSTVLPSASVLVVVVVEEDSVLVLGAAGCTTVVDGGVGSTSVFL